MAFPSSELNINPAEPENTRVVGDTKQKNIILYVFAFTFELKLPPMMLQRIFIIPTHSPL